MLNQRRVTFAVTMVTVGPSSISGSLLLYHWLHTASEHELIALVVVLLALLDAMLLGRWIVWPWLLERGRSVGE